MRSKNKYDVYAWVIKVAESSVTKEQKMSASNLIDNFINQYDLSRWEGIGFDISTYQLVNL